MKNWAMMAPAKPTDILGTLVIAHQEAGDDLVKTKLVVMSDILEDDGEVMFLSDPHFGSVRQARMYATRLAATLGLANTCSDVSLVLLGQMSLYFL
jgi:hypothetical protein